MSLEEMLPKVVHSLLEPLRGKREALEAAMTSELHEYVLKVAKELKNFAAGRGVRIRPDDDLDVIEAEIRRQAGMILDPEGSMKKKIHILTRFLEHDIRSTLHEVAEQALEEKARNEGAVERLVNEASLNINQILARAKREVQEHEEPEVREALDQKIQILDEKYSSAVVREKLRAFLGLDYCDAIRERLHHDILEAVAEFEAAGAERNDIDSYAGNLQERARRHLEDALAGLEETFPNELVRDLVRHDLSEMAVLYTDLDALAAKFGPYVQD